jgi:hypothetical protein
MEECVQNSNGMHVYYTSVHESEGVHDAVRSFMTHVLSDQHTLPQLELPSPPKKRCLVM